MSEDAALRAIHLAENEAEREEARHRLMFDEAVGMQWALAQRRHSELSESGPAHRVATTGWLAALTDAAALRADRRAARGARGDLR